MLKVWLAMKSYLLTLIAERANSIDPDWTVSKDLDEGQAVDLANQHPPRPCSRSTVDDLLQAPDAKKSIDEMLRGARKSEERRLCSAHRCLCAPGGFARVSARKLPQARFSAPNCTESEKPSPIHGRAIRLD